MLNLVMYFCYGCRRAQGLRDKRETLWYFRLHYSATYYFRPSLLMSYPVEMTAPTLVGNERLNDQGVCVVNTRECFASCSLLVITMICGYNLNDLALLPLVFILGTLLRMALKNSNSSAIFYK